jgi:heme/copper-type cytochrome/quinol oxidase subunit 3
MSSVATPRRGSLPNGVWGIALVIATEGAFLGCLIASYLYLGSRRASWPPPGIPEPHVLVPLILSGVLLATSVPMFLASFAARRGAARASWLLIFAALVVQCGYLGYQVHLFLRDLDTFSPSASAYGSAYFTLLGAHHVHVLVGILLDVWLLARVARGLTGYRVTAVRVVSWYWHFVNVIGVLITITIVSAAW